MKKRFLSILLSLAVFVSVMPISVFATEAEPQPATCSCETKCTAEAITAECALCGAENADLAVCTGADPQQEEPIAQPLTQPASQQAEEQQESTSYAVEYASAEHGTFKVMVDEVEITSGTAVESGKKVTIVATPADGYYVDSVNYNSTRIWPSNGNEYTFTMPETDVTLIVTFAEEEYYIWVAGVQFTRENTVIDSTDNDDITSGTATLTVAVVDNNGIPEQKFTLELDGFTYIEETPITSDYDDIGDDAAIVSDVPLDIVVKGTNTISGTNCICAYYNLNIKGQDKNNDKLIINYSGAEDAMVLGIMAAGKAKFADVNISITATNEYCGPAIGILNSFETSNTIIDVKTDEILSGSIGGILAFEEIKFKDSKVTVNWDTDNELEALMNAAIVTTHKMIIEDSEVYAKSTGKSGSSGYGYDYGSYGIAWNIDPVPSGGPGIGEAASAFISVKNSTVTAIGTTAAYNCKVSNLDGSLDNLAVYAGNSAEGAEEKAKDKEETYTNNKYVKIEPLIKYPVWAGGVQFTDANLTINGDDGDPETYDGTATLTVGGTAEAPTYTVTLNNFKYIGDGALTIVDGYDYVHMAAVSAKDTDLNVVLIGDNEISCTAGWYKCYGFGLYTSNGILTITSEDTNNNKLVVDGQTCGILSRYVGEGDYGLVIKNANVTADSNHIGGIITGADIENDGIGIYIEKSIVTSDELDPFFGGKVEIKESTVNCDFVYGSVLTINGSNLNCYDVYGSVLTITDSDVNATYIGSDTNTEIENSTVMCDGLIYACIWDYDIQDYILYPITITDSNVTVESEIADEDQPWALFGKVTITGNSTVTASALTAFELAPTLEGTYKVSAGATAADAAVADSTADATYANKYVKIEPMVVATPTPAPTSKPASKPTATPTPVPTATPTPAVTIKPTATPTAEPTAELQGEVVVKDKEGLLGFGGVLVQTADELTEILVSEEDKALLEEGKDIIIFLENTDISATVAEEDKQLVTDAVSSIENAQVGVYLDINLFKQIGSNEPERITNTDAPIVISVEIPQQLISKDENVQRTYYIVRVHNGQTDIIEGEFDAATGIFTFETDRFSTYTIIYTDVVTETAEPIPAPQQTSFPWWIIVVAAIAVVVVVIIVKKKSNEE